jgi:DNA-binding transcriptional ArsR family regulator
MPAGRASGNIERFDRGRSMSAGTPARAMDVAVVGAAIGDPSRAAMLTALMDGRALPASVLAYWAGITPQTASAHLARLEQAKLVVVEADGRQRNFRLANEQVAHALEGLMALAPSRPRAHVPAAEDGVLFPEARLCYDHLAGALGVRVLAALVGRRLLVPKGKDFELSTRGARWFAALGIEVSGVRHRRRHFARACLDLTERRHHLAGALGAALAANLLKKGWLRRRPEGRAVSVSKAGQTGFKRELGISLPSG